MKTRVLFVLVLVFMISCSKSDFQEYEVFQGHLQLFLPIGWTQDDSGENVMFGNENGTALTSSMYVNDKFEFKRFYEARYQSVDDKIWKNGTDILISKADYNVIGRKYVSESGSLWYYVYCVNKGNYGLSITFVSSTDSENENNTYNEIVQKLIIK